MSSDKDRAGWIYYQARKKGQSRIMSAVIILINTVLTLYLWSLVIYVIASWLISFRIINPWQPLVRQILMGLQALHEPVLGQIRRFIPNLGGLDISPIILLLAVEFLRNLLLGGF